MTQLVSNLRTSARVFLAVSLLAAPAGLAAAQQTVASNAAPAQPAPAPAAASDTDPQLKLSPTKVLESFEPAADAEYELGPGDEISINVPGHAELTGKHIVGPDGRITLPIGGTVEVQNKTRLGASEAIKDALTPYYVGLDVTLSVDKYGSNHITVLGNVQHPGVLQYDTTPTLLDAIARAGIITTTGPNKDGLPTSCVIYRGNDQSVTVDLRSLLQSGNRLADMRLRRGDFIFVPAPRDEFISVMGQVSHPGAVAYSPDLTLHQALALAGGLTDAAGKTITIVQAATNKTITITYKQMMMPNGDREITLHAGDIIAVPKSGFSKVTAVVTKLSPIATMVALGALLQ
jgi:polysaccharide export outer membrane protein